MLNTSPLNTRPIMSPIDSTITSQGTFTLNGLDLTAGTYSISGISDNLNVALSAYDIPQADGRGFLSNFKRGRTINITIKIIGTGEEDFLNKVDEFRKVCFQENSVFDWKRNGVIRRIILNCTSQPNALQHFNIDFNKYEVTFTALESYWYELSNQSKTLTDITASFASNITTQGTAGAFPLVYVLFGSTNTTEVKFKVGDNEVVVTHNFADNDNLRIDSKEARVFVNDLEIDSSGPFPVFETGANLMEYTFDGTFDADITILNRKNYV